MRYTTSVVMAVALLMPGANAGSQTQRRVVRVSAERFAFTPSRIVVDAGEEIEMRVSSDDTAHARSARCRRGSHHSRRAH